MAMRTTPMTLSTETETKTKATIHYTQPQPSKIPTQPAKPATDKNQQVEADSLLPPPEEMNPTPTSP